MGKFKVGTAVVPTREYMQWSRNHLGENYVVSGTGELDPKFLSEILMWALSDMYPPKGVVIRGDPADPETTVRVYLESPYGSCETYLEKDHLLKKKSR